MKNIYSLLIILLALSTNAQKTQYNFTTDNWTVKNEKGLIQKLDKTTFEETPCLHLPLGHVASLKNVDMKNFRIELEIASLTMAGVGFRDSDNNNYEYIYLRILSDNRDDAIQYLPIFNGGFSWQLYNYPKYEAKSQFPKKYLQSVDVSYSDFIKQGIITDSLRIPLEKNEIILSNKTQIQALGEGKWIFADSEKMKVLYFVKKDNALEISTALTWVHVKIEVIENKASIYVEDMEIPKLVVDDLKHINQTGTISLRNFFTECYFANVSVEKLVDTFTSTEQTVKEELSLNYLSSWKLSPKFTVNENNILQQIDSMQNKKDNWRQIKSDTDGLINLSRFFENTEGSVILSTTVNSASEQTVKMLFDYVDQLIVVQNNQIVYNEKIIFGNNGGRVVDGEENIELNLMKGKNKLTFVLTSGQAKQNWGFIAKLEHLDYIKIE